MTQKYQTQSGKTKLVPARQAGHNALLAQDGRGRYPAAVVSISVARSPNAERPRNVYAAATIERVNSRLSAVVG